MIELLLDVKLRIIDRNGRMVCFVKDETYDSSASESAFSTMDPESALIEISRRFHVLARKALWISSAIAVRKPPGRATRIMSDNTVRT